MFACLSVCVCVCVYVCVEAASYCCCQFLNCVTSFCTNGIWLKFNRSLNHCLGPFCLALVCILFQAISVCVSLSSHRLICLFFSPVTIVLPPAPWYCQVTDPLFSHFLCEETSQWLNNILSERRSSLLSGSIIAAATTKSVWEMLSSHLWRRKERM